MAVEIDKNLIPILEDTLQGFDNVEVINEDVLKLDLAKLAQEKNDGKPLKVVANLPYYITTPIIMGLFENQVPVSSITVMVQKEVADRMQAGPGTKDYGALSLAVQYYVCLLYTSYICRNHSDRKSIRAGEIPDSLRADQLPQLSVCSRRNHQ